MLHPRRLLVLGGLLAVVGAVAGIALAAIPGSDGTITGCLKKSGGNLRVIDAAVTNCKSDEQRLDWNVQGPAGQAGENGTNGTDGVSGWEMVTDTRSYGSDTTFAFGGLSVDCPTGKKVVGGGGSVLTDEGATASGYNVLQSYPESDGTGWHASFEVDNAIGNPFTETVYAICVSAA